MKETVNLLGKDQDRAQRSPSRELSPNRLDDVEEDDNEAQEKGQNVVFSKFSQKALFLFL